MAADEPKSDLPPAGDGVRGGGTVDDDDDDDVVE
eukprot:CAMPEP_0170735438 /NCGR_PEP_ID=MMETSP0437-20130122/3097_1 /TAXON_ID=0 /ORGANISM="Sexangularia sp." /LENGTH=33 /DNA_ID= /DNA_START= /DNA_END= /DNA_ORIENTATION=